MQEEPTLENDELLTIYESSKIENKGLFNRLKDRKINKKKGELAEEIQNLKLIKLEYNKTKIEEAIKFYEKTIKQKRINIIKKVARDEETEE